MEGNNETIKEVSQASSGQKPRNSNQFKARQFSDSSKSRKNITRNTRSANVPNHPSGAIEQHQPVSSNETTEDSRLNQPCEADNVNSNDKAWINNSNRRQGQNVGYKNDRRGSLKDGYSNQDRRYNNSRNTNGHGATENRNGKRQFSKGGNSFRSNSRGRGYCQSPQTDCTGERDNKRNGPGFNSPDIRSSPTTASTENHTALPAKPNAWTGNTCPITKAFENTALKGLLPASTEEENEMLERALKLSLEEEQWQQNNYSGYPTERKCSISSESEIFINEAEEAKKMLQTSDFPPLPMAVVDAAGTVGRIPCHNMAGGAKLSESEIVAQSFAIEQHENEISRIGHASAGGENEGQDHASGGSVLESWDRFGARPKKKSSTPIGRGFGRGRKVFEGKIGELVSPSGLLSTPPSVPPKAQNATNPNIPSCIADFEQFEPAEVSSIMPKSDLHFCATENEAVTRIGPSQVDVPFVDPSCIVSKLSSPENVQQVQIVGSAATQMQTTSNVTPQVKILGKATPEIKALEIAVPQATVLGRVMPHLLTTSQTDAVGNLVESASMHGAAQMPVQMPLILDVAETEGNMVEVSPQSLAMENTDYSKDEEIRALREELNRLKYNQNGNHPEAAHFPPPYGVLPLHVPYILPMAYYRYPIPGMPLPVVRNEGGMFDSSFPPVPYTPNARAICAPDMIQVQQPPIPMCNTVASSSSPSNSSGMDRPMLNSDLSPNAEEFHPREIPPKIEEFHQVRNDRNCNNSEGQKSRQKHKRGAPKHFHWQYHKSNPSNYNYNYNNGSPNFTPLPAANSHSIPNFQLPMSAPPPGNQFSTFNYARGHDRGPVC